jgi:hypothetical protein
MDSEMPLETQQDVEEIMTESLVQLLFISSISQAPHFLLDFSS